MLSTFTWLTQFMCAHNFLQESCYEFDTCHCLGLFGCCHCPWHNKFPDWDRSSLSVSSGSLKVTRQRKHVKFWDIDFSVFLLCKFVVISSGSRRFFLLPHSPLRGAFRSSSRFSWYFISKIHRVCWKDCGQNRSWRMVMLWFRIE